MSSRFTFDAAVDDWSVWSPEGRGVVFTSNRKGVRDLFEKPANGAKDEQPLLVTSQDKAPLDWSRLAVRDPGPQDGVGPVGLADDGRAPFGKLRTPRASRGA